jgi:hypothetical protein
MILSASQPYFAPFPGFFYKAHLSDIFVLLDSVQFPRGTTWITRNRFKNDQGTLWMTIPVWKKGLGLQNIEDVSICHEGHWAQKHLTSLQHAYAHAPYFSEHMNFVREMFSNQYVKLIDLNLAITRYLIKHLAVQTDIKLQSAVGIRSGGTQLLIDMCQYFGASTFLAQQPAAKYLDADLFQQAGILLKFFKPTACIYPQLWGNFVDDLSALDLLFNCGPKARDILIADKQTI